jgi:RNA polymerase sigma-70 factor (sigma-E family)
LGLVPPPGDPKAAVLEAYLAHYSDLVRLGYLLVGDHHQAEDLAHESFLRLYDAWDRVDPARVLPYLRMTLLNQVRSSYRRAQVAARRTPPPGVDAASAEDAALGRMNRSEVLNALARLPERQRTCVVLRHYLRMTEGEIAEALGCSVGSVRTHVRRGHEALQRSLGGSIR